MYALNRELLLLTDAGHDVCLDDAVLVVGGEDKRDGGWKRGKKGSGSGPPSIQARVLFYKDKEAGPRQ